MKVKELLKELRFANPNANVQFYTKTDDKVLEILSIYDDSDGTVDKNNVPLSELNKRSKQVYIDLG